MASTIPKPNRIVKIIVRHYTSVATDIVDLIYFAGLLLIEAIFQRIRLRDAVGQLVRFAQLNNRLSVSESLESLPYPRIQCLG